MITSNVIHRAFHIRSGEKTGTCFTIDHEKKQYLITARHLATHIEKNKEAFLYHDKRWKKLPIHLIGHCEGEVDISVFFIDDQISPSTPFEPTSVGLVYGQDAYFLGFPYGISGHIGSVNHGYPLPFVKRAIVSCLHTTDEGKQTIFLDGHNNPGFSGGPVIFKKRGEEDFKVAGVISGFQSVDEPIYTKEDTPANLSYRNNTGIIISYGIGNAITKINENPCGTPIIR